MLFDAFHVKRMLNSFFPRKIATVMAEATEGVVEAGGIEAGVSLDSKQRSRVNTFTNSD